MAEIYLCVALLVGTALSVVTPPFYTSDEGAHARRAIEIGHGMLLAQHTAEGSGGPIDRGFLEFERRFDGVLFVAMHLRPAERLSTPGAHVTAETFAATRELRWTGERTFSNFANTAVYPPLFYLPQAAGFRVAEAAGWTIQRSIWLARWLAMVCACALGWLALRVGVLWRWQLALYLLMPTLLNLTAACSQDALLLPTAGLLMAVLGRALAGRRGLSRAELAVCTLLLAAIVAARPPYLPLALTLLLPGLEMEGAEAEGIAWQRFTGPVLGMVCVAVLAGGWLLAVHGDGVWHAHDADPALQLAFVRAHPLRAAWPLLKATLFEPLRQLLKGVYVLGFDAPPPVAVQGLLLLGAAGVAATAEWPGVRRRSSRMLLLGVLLAVTGGLGLAEYLIWTVPGQASVDGLWPRYYVTLLPFFFLLFRSQMRLSERKRRWLPVAAVVFVLAVVQAPWWAAEGLYGTGLGAALRMVFH